ncbi:hypothetical protein SK128_001890, partial [Halocaridina rubra]
GFSFFAPPARVEPNECLATNGLLTVGTCYNKQSCTEAGGVDSGTCPTGGVCCVIPSVCGGTIGRNRTWFVNKDFPERSRDSADCTVTIQKEIPRVKQARLDFQSLQLEGPRRGRCLDDYFEVTKKENINGRDVDVEITPKLCGDNSFQHVYVDMENDVTVRVKLQNHGQAPGREWRVLVTQLDSQNNAPPNCLQYHSEGKAEVRSLNYGTAEFKDDLNYDICFSKLQASNRVEDSCTRKFTNVDIEQKDSYRMHSNTVRRRKMSKNKHNRPGRSTESRLLLAHSSPIQSLPSKDMDNVNLDKQMEFPRTISVPQTETAVEDAQVNEISSSLSNETASQKEASNQSSSKKPVEDISNSPDQMHGMFPMLYSSGNEEVISQIQRVVLQLQQEQLGNGAIPGSKGDFNSFNTLRKSSVEVTTPDFLSDDAEATSELPRLDLEQNSGDTEEVNENSLEYTKPDDDSNKPVVDSQDIDDSVNSVSDIINDFLAANIITTTDTSEFVTDNFAVEGSVAETVLTLNGDTIELSAGLDDIETQSKNDSSSAEHPVSNTGDEEDNDMLNQTDVTEAYTLEDILTTPSDSNMVPGDDSNAETNNFEYESGNTQAEITVLDPESVQVHGNLVFMSNSGEEKHKNDSGQTSADEASGFVDDMTDDDMNDKGDDDMSIKDDSDMNNEDDDQNKDAPRIPGAVDIDTEESNSLQIENEVIQNTKDDNLNENENIQYEYLSVSYNDTSDNKGVTENHTPGIQWLILEDSEENQESNDPSPDIAPEVVVSSDIGFSSFMDNNQFAVVTNYTGEKDTNNDEMKNEDPINDNSILVDESQSPVHAVVVQSPDSSPANESDTEVNIQSHNDATDTESKLTDPAHINANDESETEYEAEKEVAEIEFITESVGNDVVTQKSVLSQEHHVPILENGEPSKYNNENNMAPPEHSESIAEVDMQDEILGSEIMQNDNTNNSLSDKNTVSIETGSESESPSSGYTENETVDGDIIEMESNSVNESNIEITIDAVSATNVDNDNSNRNVNTSIPNHKDEENHSNDDTPAVSEVDDTQPEITFPTDEEQCGGSFLKVGEKVICGGQLRSDFPGKEAEEDDRFKNVERIQVRALEGASRSLQFEFQYETHCPEQKEDPTPAPPVKKTVTLLQYLLGWYR